VGPIPHVWDVNYGVTGADNNDGHSRGEDDPSAQQVIYFSGDDLSVGAVNTEYNWQAGLLQAAGDRFVTNGPTTLSPAAVMAGGGQANIAGPIVPGRTAINLISANQDRYYAIPSIRPFRLNQYVPNPGETAMDDVDALELLPIDLDGDNIHDTNIYFSLDGTSPSLGGLSPADVLLSPAGVAGFGLYAGWATLGLAADDEIDALAVWDMGILDALDPGTDYAIFSLAPGSPFLLSGGFSPADIFVTDFTGLNALYLSAASIGMLPTDNVDGIDVEVWSEEGDSPFGFGTVEVWEIPEPLTLGLMAVGGLALLRRRRA